MKKIFVGALAALYSFACFAITYTPLSLISSAGSTSGQFITSTGPSSSPAWTTVTLSGLGGLAAANNLSDLASASTARTNLGLGSAAVVNTGTSGATVPLLSTANTWTLAQAFTVRPTFNGNTPYDTGNLAIGNYLTTASAASTYATIAQATTALAATGGSINGVTVGQTTPLAGSFTTLSATGTVSGAGFTSLLSPYATTASVTTAIAAVTPTALTSYTPTVTAGSGTFTTTSSTGHYYVIGKLVYFELSVSITTVGTASGNVIATLPFATNTSSGVTAFAGIENATTGKSIQGFANANANTVAMRYYDATTAIAAGVVLVLSGVYVSN